MGGTSTSSSDGLSLGFGTKPEWRSSSVVYDGCNFLKMPFDRPSLTCIIIKTSLCVINCQLIHVCLSNQHRLQIHYSWQMSADPKAICVVPGQIRGGKSKGEWKGWTVFKPLEKFPVLLNQFFLHFMVLFANFFPIIYACSWMVSLVADIRRYSSRRILPVFVSFV